jgi:uncharacterized membrane protein
MKENIIKSIIGLFGGLTSKMLTKYIIIFIISLMPVLELRGGLIAAALLKINPVVAYIICIIGNLIPVPLILWFLDYIFDFLKKHQKLTKFVSFCEKKCNDKKGQIEKYGFWGLVLFIGIPIPGTGAWTGCLIASLLRMNRKKAFLAAFLGIIMASIIMMLVSYGLLSNLI